VTGVPYLFRSVFSALLLFSFVASAEAQRPSERFKATLLHGSLEPRVRSFVSSCLGATSIPKPLQMYSQGAWFVTSDLVGHVRQDGYNDDGTAQLWELQGKPRAVSLWVHDDEFDRSTLACLNAGGTVTRQVNEYMPGLSEPNLHWIFVHTLTLEKNGQYRASGHYTDWDRHPIAAPKLTSEDQDFIAGERQFHQWKDFDFVSAVERYRQQ